jgi:catechol 2,3-dioxygenase
MPRGVVDLEGLKSPEAQALRRLAPPAGLPFKVQKLGHVVLRVKDLQRSVAFYTKVLGFHVSDVYPETMMKGGMAFLRCNADHHCLALVGGMKGDASAKELHHLAFEVATLDEVVRAREHLRAAGVKIDFDGRRRAGCQVAVEFRDPDNHFLEIFWGLDQVGTDNRVRPPAEWREEHSLEDAIRNAPPGQDTTRHK